MLIAVREFDKKEYPDDPALLSSYHGQYSHQKLILKQKDQTHFDFVFLPTNAKSATITFKNIDASLMTPGLPNWARNSNGNLRIALTDRGWNRQQVSFPVAQFIQVAGGDGSEKNNLYSAELAKNCLNAGLWEVQLYTFEAGEKKLYYHGWFTFPLGFYKQLFEFNTKLSYWKTWYYLEHWVNPAGLKLNLSELRQVKHEKSVSAKFDPDENVPFEGEQKRKYKNIVAKGLNTWSDFFSNQAIAFSTFVPPGIYRLDKPWKNEYWRLADFNGAILRNVISPGIPNKTLQELVLLFSDRKGDKSQFIISGFDINQLPHLNPKDYSKGYFMLMGIGTPTVHQEYQTCQKEPPDKSPFFSVYLDPEDKWINHHDVAIDGSILFLDKTDPKNMHVYLVSYERHSLIAHYIINL